MDACRFSTRFSFVACFLCARSSDIVDVNRIQKVFMSYGWSTVRQIESEFEKRQLSASIL